MTVFGTVGIFVKYINLPSAFVAMSRGVVGALFLLVFLLITKKGIDIKAIGRNLIPLLLSGAAIGVNWIFLFESYRYTTVATATLCYYMAPVIVIIFGRIIYKEKITLKKGICSFAAVIGMLLVSGIFTSQGSASSDFRGVLFGLAAAAFYASVTLISHCMKDISSYDMTLVQLTVAAIVVAPYSFIAEDVDFLGIEPISLILLFVVGILHTGICYALYFSSVKSLPAQKVALFAYIDPILAVILSAIVLKEEMGVVCAVGAVIILISMIISEIPDRRSSKSESENAAPKEQDF